MITNDHLYENSSDSAPLAPSTTDFPLPAEDNPRPQPNPLVRIFIGDEGIRAGWSALIFLAIALLSIIMGVGLAARGVQMTKTSMTHPGIMVVIEALEVLGVFLATFVMAMIESRPIFSYGYLGARLLPRFLSGVLCGFVALTTLVCALWRGGLLVFDGRMLTSAAALRYGLVWAFAFLLVGLFEESLMRGYLQFTLTRGLTLPGLPSGIGFWIAALVLSAAFGAIHTGNPGESPVGLFAAGAIGLVFCLSLWYTKSLWWAVGFHASWDWAESYFYGTADSGTHVQGYLFATHPVGPVLWSGGATGPEGSILVLPLILLIALAMWTVWGRNTVAPASSL